MNRGNRKARIFEDDRDRKRFARLYWEATAKYGVETLAALEMTTHFHSIVTTPRGNLSVFMQQFEGEFARYSNWRHGRIGHLFQGRFRRVLIENDIHLFVAAAYVYENPVSAGIVGCPEGWKWSTYAATIGIAPVPESLSLDWVRTLFPAQSLKESQAMLRSCIENPMQLLSYLEAVDPTTEAAIRSYIAERRSLVAQPCRYDWLVRPPLEVLFSPDLRRTDLAAAIKVAHEKHGYKIAEIALHLGKRPATLSKIYCRLRKANRLR